MGKIFFDFNAYRIILKMSIGDRDGMPAKWVSAYGNTIIPIPMPALPMEFVLQCASRSRSDCLLSLLDADGAFGLNPYRLGVRAERRKECDLT